MFKFIVLADLHMVPNGELSHGLDTASRVSAAIEHVNELHSDAELCIVAGDLADNGDIASYERLKPLLDRLEIPCYPTLGNHDDRGNFLKAFGEPLAAETGFVDHVVNLHGQTLIVLDSLDQGKHPGRIADSQLGWLAFKLEDARTRPVIVVLHHNVSTLNVSTDSISLQNGDELAEVLSMHSDVRHVVSGHVHLSASGMFRGVPFTTFAGCHYNIAPRPHDPNLRAPRPHDPNLRAPRLEGPGQYAVVWSGDESTVVLLENFLDRHLAMPPELFR